MSIKSISLQAPNAMIYKQNELKKINKNYINQYPFK